MVTLSDRSAAGRRLVPNTRKPAFCRALAVACPMPVDAPVTRATPRLVLFMEVAPFFVLDCISKYRVRSSAAGPDGLRKAGTAPPILAGRSPTTSSGSLRMPERPARRRDQDVSTPAASGVTAPRPLTTIRRIYPPVDSGTPPELPSSARGRRSATGRKTRRASAEPVVRTTARETDGGKGRALANDAPMAAQPIWRKPSRADA